MAVDGKSRRKLAKSLERTRAKHAVMLAKVEKTRAKLAKRTRKLQTTEARMADLERRLADPRLKKMGQAGRPEAGLRRARLIVNPNSGADDMDNSKRLVEIVGCLREHGVLAAIDLKTSGKAARQLAQEAVEKEEELVIVAGGDGTIEEVAAQLVGTQTTLGIVPVGTMNNLARALGIPLAIEDACQLIGLGISRRIDVGRMVTQDKSNSQAAYFMEAAGIGLSAVVIPMGQAFEKRRRMVVPAALGKILDSQPDPIQVELDDGQMIEACSQMVTVSNAPLMGKNLLIAPDAKMDDGQLDIAVYDGMGRTELLNYFSGTGNGSRPQNPKVRFYRSNRVRVRANRKLPASSDKEALDARREFEIQAVPHALSVIVGKGIGLSLPVEAVPSVPPLSGAQKPAKDKKSSGNGHLQKQPLENH